MILPADSSQEDTAIVGMRDVEEQILPLSKVTKIESIVAEPGSAGAPILYRVTVANDASGEFTARLTADELTTFEGFQAALLGRFGAEFDDRGRFTGHHGTDRWQTFVYDMIGRELSA